jgi:hypothetical protein
VSSGVVFQPAPHAAQPDPEDLIASWHVDSRERMDQAIRARDRLVTDQATGLVSVDGVGGIRVGDVDLTDLTGHLQAAVLAALEMLIVCLLDIRVRVRDAERDVPASRQGRAAAGLVGIATRTSPSIARMILRAAQRVTATMPGMFTALATRLRSRAPPDAP